MPVARLGKFFFDHVTDQEYFASAQQFADDKGSEGRNKYHGDAADDAGDGQRERDFKKGLYIIRPQVFGGFRYLR